MIALNIDFSINGIRTSRWFKNVNITTESQHRTKFSKLMDFVIGIELSREILIPRC